MLRTGRQIAWNQNYWRTFQRLSSSSTFKFDIKYAFKVFDEHFSDLKPIEFVKCEFNDKEPVFIFPGFEGKMRYLDEFIRNLQRPVYCFQYPFEKSPINVHAVAENIIQFFKTHTKNGEKLNIIAHSFGGLVALSTIREVQYSNKVHLCLTDSTPYAIKFMASESYGNFNNENELENNLLRNVLSWMNVSCSQKFHEVFAKSLPWSQKLQNFIQKLPEHSKFSKQNLHTVIDGFYGIIRSVFLYDENFEKFEINTSLIRSPEKILPFPDDFRENKYFAGPTRILFTKGNHFTMLSHAETANIINKEFENY